MKTYPQIILLLCTGRVTQRLTFYILFMLFVLSIPFTIWAEGDELRFDSLTLEHGLSQTTVLSIVQDFRGFMWFGTVDGLNRFDGYNFTVYTNVPTNPNSLSDDWITSLYLSNDSTLWIGTLRAGLNRYSQETDSFVHYYLDVPPQLDPLFKKTVADLPAIYTFVNSRSIQAICEDDEKNLWIGTFGNGLFRLKPGESLLKPVKLDTFTGYDLSHNITSIVYTENSEGGVLWLGTFGGGLIKYKKGKEPVCFRHDPANRASLSNNQIMVIYPDPDEKNRTLWIGTMGGGLEKFDIATGKFSHFQHQAEKQNSLSHNSVLTILKDQQQQLWIGTLCGGLNKLNLKTNHFTHYQHDRFNPYSIGSDEVLALYEDRSGIMWVGTNLGHGINKVDKLKNKFISYRHEPTYENSLSGNVIFSIFEDKNRFLWIGTFQNGLNRFDRLNNQFTHFKADPKNPHSISDNHVRVIYEDRLGRFWIGTFNGGLNLFDRKTQKFTHYLHHPNDSTSLSANQVRAIYEDSLGNLWIGTFGGFNKFNPESGTFTHYKADPDNPTSIADDRIYAICEAHQGRLWVATFDGGLAYFDPQTGNFTHFVNNPFDDNSISDNRVFCILKDPDNSDILWLGTSGGGLNKFDTKNHRFTRFTQLNGLPNDVIYGIIPDDSGNLWMSTNKGLAKFDRKNELFTNYDLTDGLQSNEFNAGAYFRSQSGELFFGGINGFNCFYPNQIQVNNNIPPIVLTSFKVFDKDMDDSLGPISGLSEIELSYEDNFISFEFSALDFTKLEKNQFAYKMEGLSDTWIKCGTRRFVNFTGLAPGDYTFRVKGSNCDGVWNEAGTSIKLKIHPPFWETWWFSFLMFTLIVATAWFFHRRRVRISIRRSLELERIRIMENERVRKAVAADFHDELGQKLTRISLFSEIVKRKMRQISPENMEYIEKINSVAKELSSSTRDFIWTLDPEQDSLYDIALYLKDFGDEVFDKTGIQFRVGGITKELETVKLPVKWRRHLTLIFKEGMHNIIKHANGSNVLLEFSVHHRLLKIALADNGVGMDELYKSNGLGLKSMKNRAQILESKLNIFCKNGRGTVIEFSGEIP